MGSTTIAESGAGSDLVQLYTLGRVALVRDGLDLTSKLGPKHLALLIYLFHEDRPMHPSEVIALLGRNQAEDVELAGLEKAVRWLGKNVQGVRIAMTRETVQALGGLSLDSRDVDDAIDRRDAERAGRLCTGLFLEGFESGSDPFAKWAEKERARLQRAWGQAFASEAKVAEGAGRWEMVAHWRRAAVGLAAVDEDAVADLLEAMVRAGDREGAGVEYGRYLGRLRAAGVDTVGDKVKRVVARHAIPERGPSEGSSRATGPAAAVAPEDEPSDVVDAAPDDEAVIEATAAEAAPGPPPETESESAEWDQIVDMAAPDDDEILTGIAEEPEESGLQPAADAAELDPVPEDDIGLVSPVDSIMGPAVEKEDILPPEPVTPEPDEAPAFGTFETLDYEEAEEDSEPETAAKPVVVTSGTVRAPVDETTFTDSAVVHFIRTTWARLTTPSSRRAYSSFAERVGQIVIWVAEAIVQGAQAAARGTRAAARGAVTLSGRLAVWARGAAARRGQRRARKRAGKRAAKQTAKQVRAEQKAAEKRARAEQKAAEKEARAGQKAEEKRARAERKAGEGRKGESGPIAGMATGATVTGPRPTAAEVGAAARPAESTPAPAPRPLAGASEAARRRGFRLPGLAALARVLPWGRRVARARPRARRVRFAIPWPLARRLGLGLLLIAAVGAVVVFWPAISETVGGVTAGIRSRTPSVSQPSMPDVSLPDVSLPELSPPEVSLPKVRIGTPSFVEAAWTRITGMFAGPLLEPGSRVLVADFDVDEKGAGALGRALALALEADLRQARQIGVVTRERALVGVGRRSSARLTAEEAVGLASEAGYAGVIVGRVLTDGQRYRVEARLVDGRGDEIDRVEVAGTEPTLAIEGLATELRERLGEPAERVRASEGSTDMLTRSPAALIAYATARDHLYGGRYGDAVRAARTATERDPEFAMAWRVLAEAYALTGRRSAARRALDEAWESRERLTERERLRVAADRHVFAGRLSEAVLAYDHLFNRYRDDVGALKSQAIVQRMIGSRGGGEGNLRVAYGIDPVDWPSLARTARFLGYTGELPDIESLVETVGTTE